MIKWIKEKIDKLILKFMWPDYDPEGTHLAGWHHKIKDETDE